MLYQICIYSKMLAHKYNWTGGIDFVPDKYKIETEESGKHMEWFTIEYR